MAKLNHVERGTRSGRPADAVVVLLHGMGSNGERAMKHADWLGEAFPNVHFYAPDGPIQYAPATNPAAFDVGPSAATGQFMWFSGHSMATWTEGLYETLEKLESYIGECVAAQNLDRPRAVIVGISQGAIAALFCVPRFKRPIGASIAHSGFLFHSTDSLVLGRSQLPQLKEEVASTTPSCLIHGLTDGPLPWQTDMEVATLYEERDIPVEFHLLGGLRHAAMETRSQAITKEFIQRHLYPSVPPAAAA